MSVKRVSDDVNGLFRTLAILLEDASYYLMLRYLILQMRKVLRCKSKVKQSLYTPWRRLGRGGIAPTHSRPRH
jgi:hypothetical protein